MAYITKEQVKTYLRIDNTDSDDLFDDELIPAATAIIENTTGRVFEISGATAKTFDAECDVDDDGLTLYLGEQDLYELTSVTNGDATSIATSNIVTEPRRVTPYYALKIKSSAGVSWTYSTDPEDAISITGKWGFSETPPDDIVFAAIRLVTDMFKKRDEADDIVSPMVNARGVMVMPMALPKDVERILKPYKRLV